MKKCFLPLVLSLLTSDCAKSQQPLVGLIQGKIIDQKQAPIPFATLMATNIDGVEPALHRRTTAFGPVLTIQVFETESEAVRLANDSKYGLSASIWTRDVDRPLRVAWEIDAGTIWINDWAVVYDEFEEGGFKESGNGRLNGWTAMDEFLEYKHVAFHSGTVRETQGTLKHG